MITVVRSTMRIPCSGPEALMRSVSRGAAVGARLGPALQGAGRGVDEDRLVSAAVAIRPDGLVHPADQLREDLLGNASLDRQDPAALRLRAARRGRGAQVLDARRFAGGLHVHAEVEQVDE